MSFVDKEAYYKTIKQCDLMGDPASILHDQISIYEESKEHRHNECMAAFWDWYMQNPNINVQPIDCLKIWQDIWKYLEHRRREINPSKQS